MKCCPKEMQPADQQDVIYNFPAPRSNKALKEEKKDTSQRQTDFAQMSSRPSRDVTVKKNFYFTELRMGLLIGRPGEFKIFACDFLKCDVFKDLLLDKRFNEQFDAYWKKLYEGYLAALRLASCYLKQLNGESELGHTQMYNLLLLRGLMSDYCIDNIEAGIASETLSMTLNVSSLESDDAQQITCTGQTDISIRTQLNAKTLSIIEVEQSHTLMPGNGLQPREQLWLQMEAVAQKEKCKVLRGAVLDTTAISLTIRVNGHYYVSPRVTDPWLYIQCLRFLLRENFDENKANKIIESANAAPVSQEIFEDDAYRSESGDDGDMSGPSGGDQNNCKFEDLNDDGSGDDGGDNDDGGDDDDDGGGDDSSTHECDQNSNGDNMDNMDDVDSNYHHQNIDNEECKARTNDIHSSVCQNSSDSDSKSSYSNSDSSYVDASSEYDSDIEAASSDNEDIPDQVELAEDSVKALKELDSIFDHYDYQDLASSFGWTEAPSKVPLCRAELDKLGQYSPDYALVGAGLVKNYAREKRMQRNPSKLQRGGKPDDPVPFRQAAVPPVRKKNLVASAEQLSSMHQCGGIDKENAPENRLAPLKSSGKPQRHFRLALRPVAK